MRGYLHNETSMPLIEVSLNGLPLTCLLDTGFTGDIALGLDVASRLQLETDGDVFYSKTVGADAGYQRSSVTVTWFGNNRITEAIVFRRSKIGPVDGIIGVYFLIGYVLVVDFNEGDVVIKDPSLREALP